MRVLVPVFIIAIIAVTVLIIVLSSQRRARRERSFHEINLELQQVKGTINRISSEVSLQRQASYVDWSSIETIIRYHNQRTYGEDRL